MSATLDAAAATAIARHFAPRRTPSDRYAYHYVRAKLRTDPLYTGVAEALADTTAPVLDLGCGLGLLAHALRAQGIALPYAGVDVDARKVARARDAALRAALPDATFAAMDLAREWPAHAGSVAILDVLQYLEPAAQDATLDAAAAMLVPGARLVIRTGLADGSPKARFTHFADVVGRLSGWMVSAPRRYPQGDALRARLEGAGLRVTFDRLSGNTPFNNWRVLAERF